MLRVILTKPKKKVAPLTGLLYYVDGHVVGQAIIQERRNKSSKWEAVPIIKQEDIEDGH